MYNSYKDHFLFFSVLHLPRKKEESLQNLHCQRFTTINATNYIHSWPTIAQWSLKFGSKNQRIVAYLLHILGQACIYVMCTIPIQYTWSNTNQQSLSSNSVGLLESIIETLVVACMLYYMLHHYTTL